MHPAPLMSSASLKGELQGSVPLPCQVPKMLKRENKGRTNGTAFATAGEQAGDTCRLTTDKSVSNQALTGLQQACPRNPVTT